MSHSVVDDNADPGNVSAADSEVNVGNLIGTKQWLDGQLLEYNTAIGAANSDETAGETADDLIVAVTQLQKQLQDAATNNALKTTILKRWYLGSALTDILFPPNNATPPEQLSKKVTDLVDAQNKHVKKIMTVHKEMDAMQKEIDALRKDNLELKQGNREMMSNLQQIRDTNNQQRMSAQKNANVQRSIDKVELVKAKISLVRHIFKGLILGSGINWAQDPELCDFVISLGMPLESQLMDQSELT